MSRWRSRGGAIAVYLGLVDGLERRPGPAEQWVRRAQPVVLAVAVVVGAALAVVVGLHSAGSVAHRAWRGGWDGLELLVLVAAGTSVASLWSRRRDRQTR